MLIGATAYNLAIYILRGEHPLEEREELLEKALKEHAKIEPRFADVLRSPKLL